jgi:hypothetical protein
MYRASRGLAGSGFGTGIGIKPAGHRDGVAPAGSAAMRCQAADEPVELSSIEGHAGYFARGILEDQQSALWPVRNFDLGKQACGQPFWRLAHHHTIDLRFTNAVKRSGMLHREQFILQPGLSQPLVTLGLLDLLAQRTEQAKGEAAGKEEDLLRLGVAAQNDDSVFSRFVADGEGLEFQWGWFRLYLGRYLGRCLCGGGGQRGISSIKFDGIA